MDNQLDGCDVTEPGWWFGAMGSWFTTLMFLYGPGLVPPAYARMALWSAVITLLFGVFFVARDRTVQGYFTTRSAVMAMLAPMGCALILLYGVYWAGTRAGKRTLNNAKELRRREGLLREREHALAEAMKELEAST